MGRPKRGRIGGESEAPLGVPGKKPGLFGSDAQPVAQDHEDGIRE